MRKSILIALLFITTSVTAQQRLIKYLIPRLQSDSVNITTSFILQGDTFRLSSPTNNQILKRESGIWVNSDNEASVFDSLHWNATTGDLMAYKNGAPMSTQNLDGRYLLAGNVGDSLSGYMIISVYDTAHIYEQVVGINSNQTLTNKTLILPTITNFTNAQHNHSSAVMGDTINSDHIKEGNINLFSHWEYAGGGNIRYMEGEVGIGGNPTNLLDVFGRARVEIMDISSSLHMDGLTMTDIQTGSSDNETLVTKGYVDDILVDSLSYSDEQAQDAIGTILDDGTLGDITFTYNDGTPKIHGAVEDNSHTHDGTTISSLSVSDFSSSNVSNWTNDANYITITQALGGDLTGTLTNAQVTNDSHNHTTTTLPNIIGSIDGVSNDGGDIDLVASGAITLTPNDAANTITIASTDNQNLTSTANGNFRTINISGSTGTTFTISDGDSLATNETNISASWDNTKNIFSVVDALGSVSDTIIGFLETEVDGSVTNEGSLSVSAGTVTTSVINSNTSGSSAVTLSAGSGLGISEAGSTITLTNSLPDQTVSITGAGINTVTGTYPNFTITGTEVDGSVTNEGSLTVAAGTGSTSVINSNTSGSTGVTLSAGSGLSISEAGNTITLTNSSTDQTVSITGAGINTVTGTYPNFTVTGTEVDGSVTNEGSLTVGAGSGTTSVINSNTSGSTGVTLTAGTGLGITEAGNVVTLTNSLPDQTVSITGAGINTVTGTYPSFTVTGTEVDGSISNEGSLTVGAGSGTTSVINSNTSGSTGVTLSAGTGMSITEAGNTITLTNSSTDQTVSITGAGINTVTGTYPNFTVTGTEVDGSISNEGSLTVGAGTGSTSVINSNTSGSTGVTLTAGSGLGITEAGNVVTLTNSSPDQTVSITGGGINTVTGTYPNFTVTGTEVDASTTNEIQTLTVRNDTIFLTSGGNVKVPFSYVIASSDSLIRGKGTTGSPLRADTTKLVTQYDISGFMDKSTYDNSGTANVVDVENGGTGLASLTAYSILAGGTTGTGNLQQISGTGTSGQILTSNGTGALPTWQAPGSGADNWGTQYVILNSDSLIRGRGTAASPLKADTTKLATQHDISSLGSKWSSVSGGINYPSGYVGINNATPAYALDIASTVDVAQLYSSNTANNEQVLRLKLGGTGGDYLRMLNGSGVSYFNFHALGYFQQKSISTAPSAISGYGQWYTYNDKPTFMSGAGTVYNLMTDPLTTRGDIMYRSSTATTRLPIGSANTVLSSNGTDVSWQPGPWTDGGTYLYPSSTEDIYFPSGSSISWRNTAVGQPNYMRITGSTARFGIDFISDIPGGASNFPALHVGIWGDLKIADAYSLPVADGTNGQVLTTNGGGSVSWGTVTTSEVDGSISNEGSLTVAAGTGSTSVINSNTSGSTGVTLTAGTGLSISEAGNIITLTNSSPNQTVSIAGGGINTVTGTYPNFTITGTEVDGSTTNEIQNLSLAGAALSISGGTGVNFSNFSTSSTTAGWVPGSSGVGSTYFLNAAGTWSVPVGSGDMLKSTYDNSGTANIIDIENGGTGKSSYTTYALVAGGTTSTGNLQQLAGLGTAGQVLTSTGASSLPTWQNAATGGGDMTKAVYDNSGTADLIDIENGGTNISSYTKGDLIYSSATNVLSKLAVSSDTSAVLGISNGVPKWKNTIKPQTPSATTGYVTLNYNLGCNMNFTTLTGNVTLTITNVPDGGSGTISVTHNGSYNMDIDGSTGYTTEKVYSNQGLSDYSTTDVIVYQRMGSILLLIWGNDFQDVTE